MPTIPCGLQGTSRTGGSLVALVPALVVDRAPKEPNMTSGMGSAYVRFVHDLLELWQ